MLLKALYKYNNQALFYIWKKWKILHIFNVNVSVKHIIYKINDNICIFYSMKNMNKQRKSLALMDR